MKIKRLALLASGNGTNVQQVTEYFQSNPDSGIVVDCIIYNRKEAYVATRAEKLGVEAFYMNKDDFFGGNRVVDLLRQRQIDYVILAGFLLLIPANLLKAYPGHIVNIHPALLPKYGGKGMYGNYVHEAVVAACEKETGITIHLVDEEFDHGRVLFQASCSVEPGDTAEAVAAKVHLLEKEHYPRVIHQFIEGQL